MLDPTRVEWINISIDPYAAITAPVFIDVYRRIFGVFADPSKYPILFHCWGGADRAGTVAFLLSALLGKSRENLVRDYELTSLSIWGERSHGSKDFQALLDALSSFGPGNGDLHASVEAPDGATTNGLGWSLN
ncbi:MAG: tyrosine-protein phosphatase [Kiritimatiellia bacterium]